jgi:NitT/TauT family transport system substrate-binding protein
MTMHIGIRGNTSRRTAVALLATVALAACGSSGDADGSASPATQQAASATPSGTLRLGYFANVTHAPAVIGEQEGLFAKALGDDVEIEFEYYNSGTEAIEAVFSDAIDAAFIGPNPAINGFAKSDGEAVRIVAGTTSGGASLVVRPGIDSSADLEGATLATPSLGNTQDVALRAWLADEGFETDTSGGGDVEIVAQENADTLATFQDGAIDGAWVPEPWATRLVLEGGGEVLVDETDLWPGGKFVTTHLLVATSYLEEQPANVRGLIDGLLESIEVANGAAERAQEITNAGIERITTKALPQQTISGAWENLAFTWDPIASSLAESKDDAVAAGLLDEVELAGIHDLTILNELLAERGEEEVEGL